jgi:hypothetical protein
MPLREYIGHLNLERFGRPCADAVMSIEDELRLDEQKQKSGARPGGNWPRRQHDALRHRRWDPKACRGSLGDPASSRCCLDIPSS